MTTGSDAWLMSVSQGSDGGRDEATAQDTGRSFGGIKGAGLAGRDALLVAVELDAGLTVDQSQPTKNRLTGRAHTHQHQTSNHTSDHEGGTNAQPVDLLQRQRAGQQG